MSPTKSKRLHKVAASSDEEDDSWRQGYCVNIPRRAKKELEEGKGA
jgi:hypothetical protein